MRRHDLAPWALCLALLAACSPSDGGDALDLADDALADGDRPGAHLASVAGAGIDPTRAGTQDALIALDEDGDGYDASTDCDDTTVAVNPGIADDVCNGTDDDCDGLTDEDCDCAWGTYGSSAYLFCAFTLADFDAAEAYCQAQGGHLVSVNSSGENSYVSTQTKARYDRKQWWIGFTDAATEGVWVWTSGDTSTYTNWNTNEPNDGGSGEDCAVLRTDGKWNDATCASNDRMTACELQQRTWYADLDGDGYAGDTELGTFFGVPSARASLTAGEDCDDSDPAISPDAVETCAGVGVDEDCDGWTDDAGPVAPADALTWYYDEDVDGYGYVGGQIQACTDPSTPFAIYVLNDDDCEDEDEDISPEAVELCNGIDDDCDGRLDEDQDDGDGDGQCDAIDPCPDDAPDDRNRDGQCDSDFALQVYGLVQGGTATAIAILGPPFATIRVAYGTTGVDDFPECFIADDGGETCVSVASPSEIPGSAITDRAGTAYLIVDLPQELTTGTTVWLQAYSSSHGGWETAVVEAVVR